MKGKSEGKMKRGGTKRDENEKRRRGSWRKEAEEEKEGEDGRKKGK